MISVEAEPARKLIRATMSGFLSTQEVAEFSRTEQAAVREMGCRSGEFLLLVDTSGCVIQPQDVVAAFQQIIDHSPLKAKRIAVVRGGSLSRMQTRRILVRDQAEIFETTVEAEAWLFSDESDPPSAA